MQNIKIFVASSSELDEERKKCIEIFAKVKKQHDHLMLEPVEWEIDVPKGSCKNRIQDEINPKVVDCAIVIVLFYSKVGDFTLEEYNLAVEKSKKVFVYFKRGFSPETEKEIENYRKIINLKEDLKDKALYEEYTKIDEFENKVSYALNLYLSKNYPNNQQEVKLITQFPPKATELIGRDDTLKDIEKILNEKDRVLLVNGLGGIGKTEVCRKYFWQNYEKFKFAGWVDYSSSIKESFVNQLELDISFSNDENLDEKYKKVINYLQKLGSKTLLVIDNIENIDDENLRDITRLPFKVIASSRMSFGKLFEKYPLDFLSIESCRELFRSHFESDIQEEESTYLDKVIELAGQHTLTIELLAKTAYSKAISVKELHQELTNSGFSLDGIKEKVETLWHDEKEKKRFFEHMEKVFELANVSENERHILANLSVLPSLPLLESDVRTWLGLECLDDVKSLIKKGWINEKDQSIIMHQVVGEVVRHKLQPDVKCCEKLINSFANAFSYAPEENPLDRVGLIVYGEYIIKNFNEDNRDIAALANNLSVIYIIAKGELDKALEFQLKAVEIYEKVLGKEHPDLAASYSNLSLIYQDKGELDKALEFQLKAVETREKVLGKEHPDLAVSYNVLSLIYRDKGEPDKALEFQLKAIEIFERVLGKEHPSLATSYNNLYLIYQDKEELDKALEFQLKAVEIYEKVLGKEHPDLATSYNNLCTIYYTKGELDKALEFQLKAVEIREKVLGKEHPSLATSYNNLALIYKDKGELDKALEFQLKAVDMYEKVLGKEHPSLATSYNNLSTIYQDKGELDKALGFQLKAVKIREKVQGKEHPDLAQSYNNLSMIYQDKGELDKALEFQLKAVEILKNKFPNGHPNLDRAKRNLAILQDRIKKETG